MARHSRLDRDLEASNPVYYSIPGAAKFRKIANPTREQRVCHAIIIEKTILDLQRKALQRELPEMKARCASGTFINNGGDLHEHLVRARRAALARVPDQERAKVTDRELIAKYEAAMAEKRAREAASKKETA